MSPHSRPTRILTQLGVLSMPCAFRSTDVCDSRKASLAVLESASEKASVTLVRMSANKLRYCGKIRACSDDDVKADALVITAW